jgi:hypothetical protein
MSERSLSLLAIAIFLFITALAFAADSKTISLSDAADHAVQQSQLALPGSAPFYLKATITETTNPDSSYKGTVEEYWVSPEKWRRTVTSPNFSQTLIHNGGRQFESETGDYYPLWLRNLVTAVFDPLPMLPQLKQLNSEIARPLGNASSQSCARLQSKVGIAPAQNSVFLVFCFAGEKGLLESVVTPGYTVTFKEYASFESKSVARQITSDPEPGTTIAANIDKLSELADPDEKLFAIDQPTLENTFNSVTID